MSIQIYQTLTLLVWAAALFVVWRARRKWLRLAVIAIGLIAFLAMPVRHKQEGIVSVEAVDKFERIPPKVEVDQPPFKERQRIEMAELKADSVGMKDDIHD